MIEIANDNHIGTETAKKYKFKEGQQYYGGCMFETIEEFAESVESSFFSSDESADWACIHSDGYIYVGDSVRNEFDLDYKRPKWATHVLWWGK